MVPRVYIVALLYAEEVTEKFFKRHKLVENIYFYNTVLFESKNSYI